MSENITHAGVVAFRKQGGRMHFLVVSSSDGKNWVFPKGHIEIGEAPDDTARRELEEEAGVSGEILCPLTVQEFCKLSETVRVQYFLARETASRPPCEGRNFRWIDAEGARDLLSFDDAREALRLAVDAVGNLESPS